MRSRGCPSIPERSPARRPCVLRSDRLLRWYSRSPSRALRNAFTHYVSGAAGSEESLSKFRGHQRRSGRYRHETPDSYLLGALCTHTGQSTRTFLSSFRVSLLTRPRGSVEGRYSANYIGDSLSFLLVNPFLSDGICPTRSVDFSVLENRLSFTE